MADQFAEREAWVRASIGARITESAYSPGCVSTEGIP